MVTMLAIEDIKAVLELVKDPEIPVLSVEDMGIIRDVRYLDGRLQIVITPTYSGCPAMDVIEEDISTMLKLHAIDDFDINTELSPAWTTDWITADGREKLRAFGIAPPTGKSKGALLGHDVVGCPQCSSTNTVMVSEFGSTACKAHYKCQECLEPFDYFKCV
ncbi:phenylacetate-CoA oxygenase subunit PaaJ [Sneathiella marina]|uniref:Phenylacetate-CoA oxygenase subunit PaaJ n=1 Tax=Sneathiella marina TaxID=2950108 RepID=A0ABY4W7Z3_9PROT|nr:1,2-phenylacetyl-CoA epoxidase subunit PaaD [Sneathiella marina]USG63024.1 phenylacetate-CoA oxygenase subunit PaaJ [Sneathiella marina]